MTAEVIILDCKKLGHCLSCRGLKNLHDPPLPNSAVKRPFSKLSGEDKVVSIISPGSFVPGLFIDQLKSISLFTAISLQLSQLLVQVVAGNI